MARIWNNGNWTTADERTALEDNLDIHICSDLAVLLIDMFPKYHLYTCAKRNKQECP